MLKLTSRDIAILRLCAACQVLTTSQVQRLYFDHIDASTVRRRLRKLVTEGYLESIETRIRTDNLYTLGKEGHRYLRALGWQVVERPEVPKDLDHHLGVTDIRIAIERSLKHTPDLHLRYFFAYWELGQFGWSYAVIPDGIFSLQNNRVLHAAIEFDRNTESITVFTKKLLNYRTLVRVHPVSTVILVAEHRGNIERLENGLAEIFASIPIVTVALEDLNLHGLQARCTPRAYLNGTRSVAEQMEIDGTKQNDEDGP
jgi:DNA-binding Lrp family transcriptional regulator